MIKIKSEHIKQAGRLLNRLRFTRAALPAFTHVLAQTDASGVTLSVANTDQWLETHVPTVDPDGQPGEKEIFLIPPEAFKTALKADKGTVVTLARKGSRGKRALKLGVVCGGMRVETVHPAEDVTAFPEGPLVEGSSTVVPGRTVEMLGLVARCASTDDTRHILNGVLFTPEDGGMLVATNGRRLANPISKTEAEALLRDDSVVMQQKFDGRRMLVRKTATGDITGINRRGFAVALPGTIAMDAARLPDSFLIDGEAVGDTLHAFDLLRRNAEGVVFKRSRSLYHSGRPASGGDWLKFKFVETASFIVAGSTPTAAVWRSNCSMWPASA